jgi:glucokinase
MKFSIGVDLGATNLRVALGNEEGHIYSQLKERTDKSNGPLGINLQIIRMIKSIEDMDKIRCIGVGSAGPLDMKKGVLTHPPNIGFDFVPIIEPLKNKFKIPVFLANDCIAGVVAEKEFGYGKELSNIIYVTLSSGIGGGVFVDNHLLKGKDGNASEIGHIVIDSEGKLTCGCGKKGHWEAYCGGSNISNLVKLFTNSRNIDGLKSSILFKIIESNLNELSPEKLFNLAHKGDKLALKIIREIGRLNAIGFATLTNVYDPELISIGGSIAIKNSKLILNPIIKLIDQFNINRIPEIKITKFGEDAVLYGALSLSKYLKKI